MLYTNEQLAAMTAEQLKAAILELQGQPAENAAVTPAQESNEAPITIAQNDTKAGETTSPVQA